MRALATAISGLMAVLSIPIMLLNFLGGIVGGIWLLILGRWADFGVGMLILFGGAFATSILLMPSLLAAGPGMALLSRGKTALAVPLMLISMVWTYAVITAWCVVTFVFLLGHSDGHRVPYLLWAYANAIGPWAYLASKDARADPDSASILTTFFAELGCLAMMGGVLFANVDPSVHALLPIFLPFIGLALVVQIAMLFAVRAEYA